MMEEASRQSNAPRNTPLPQEWMTRRTNSFNLARVFVPRSPLWLFAIVTLTPVPLIAAAVFWGGLWGALALGYLILFTAALDTIVTLVTPATEGDEFPAARGLTSALGIVHFAVLGSTIYGLTSSMLAPAEQIAAFAAAALWLGQVSNANAHELIHRPKRWMHRLGMWVYISVLFGHHTSAHPLVHHVHVGTSQDPSTAQLGESFYRFVPRAWLGSFVRGWEEESRRSRRIGRAGLGHPYVLYISGGIMVMAASVVIGGVPGLAIYLGLCLVTQLQLMLSDYVQHYGLSRYVHGDKLEPIGPRHSWNAPHFASSALTLNATRHSDHHTQPNKPYAALELPNAEEGPMLPYALPVMAVMALNPWKWRRTMDPRARFWA